MGLEEGKWHLFRGREINLSIISARVFLVSTISLSSLSRQALLAVGRAAMRLAESLRYNHTGSQCHTVSEADQVICLVPCPFPSIPQRPDCGPEHLSVVVERPRTAFNGMMLDGTAGSSVGTDQVMNNVSRVGTG